MEISKPNMNGIDATESITEQLTQTKVLIFSMLDRVEFVNSPMQAGAAGYIVKDTTSEEVYWAIKAVAAGMTHFSSSIAKALIENPTKLAREKLTTREQVILSYIAQGQSSKAVAKILSISFRTVEAQRRNIKTKLTIDTFAGLVRYAVNQGLIES